MHERSVGELTRYRTAVSLVRTHGHFISAGLSVVSPGLLFASPLQYPLMEAQ